MIKRRFSSEFISNNARARSYVSQFYGGRLSNEDLASGLCDINQDTWLSIVVCFADDKLIRVSQEMITELQHPTNLYDFISTRGPD